MRILVTGGAGFIGSHVVDALTDAGHDAVVLDSLPPHVHAARPDYLHPDVELIEADICDGRAVKRAIAGADAICHQAAMVGLGLDIGDITAYVRSNDLGTAVLLEQLARADFGGRIVLASSMVVYGEGGYRCETHGRLSPPPRDEQLLRRGQFDPVCTKCGAPLTPYPITEDAPADPRNVYAATKLQQEHLCFAFSRETGVPVAALRYHNVYGPRMPRDTPYSGVAAIFASAIAAGLPPQVYEDGLQKRDFVHVRDVARANVCALTRPKPARGAFNIASGAPRTIRDLADALTSAAGRAAGAPQVTGQYRLGDVRHVFASPEKAARELGFAASEDFEAGMAEFAHAPLRRAA